MSSSRASRKRGRAARAQDEEVEHEDRANISGDDSSDDSAHRSEEESPEDADSPDYDPRRFAVAGMIVDCYDKLLEADDLEEFQASKFPWEKVADLGLAPETHRVEQATICLGLSLMHIDPDEHCYGRIRDKLLTPLRSAVAQRRATPDERKIKFLKEADLGFTLNEVAGNKLSQTFIYRSHEMTMHCLKVDMLITHFQLSILCQYRVAGNELKEGDKFKQVTPGRDDSSLAINAGLGQASRNKLQLTSLFTLINASKQEVLKLCQDDGIAISNDSSSAKIFAAAIMRAVKADKLVEQPSKMQSQLEKAMPTAGWTALVRLNEYGKRHFPHWSDLDNPVDCVFRILQGLLLAEGIRTVPNSMGHLVPVGPTDGVMKQSFEPLLNWQAKTEPDWHFNNYQWKWVDQNLGAYGIYFGQSLFSIMDERLRRAINKQCVAGHRHVNDGVNNCFKELVLGRAVTSRIVKNRTFRVTYLCPWELILVTSHTANPGILPKDFVLGLWILQNIGHAHRTGRQRLKEEKAGHQSVHNTTGHNAPGGVREQSNTGHSPADQADHNNSMDVDLGHDDANLATVAEAQSDKELRAQQTSGRLANNSIADTAAFDFRNEEQEGQLFDDPLHFTGVDPSRGNGKVPSNTEARSSKQPPNTSKSNKRGRPNPTHRDTRTSKGIPKGNTGLRKEPRSPDNRPIHHFFPVLKTKTVPSVPAKADAHADSTCDDNQKLIDSDENDFRPQPGRKVRRRRQFVVSSEEEEEARITGQPERKKARASPAVYLPPVDIQSVPQQHEEWDLSSVARLSLTFDAGDLPGTL